MSPMAGTNVWVDIAQWTNQDDNSIGGAVVTGSWIHSNVPMHIEAMKPDAQLMQVPGGQIVKTYIAAARSNHVEGIKENDRMKVVKPFHHPLLGSWLVIHSIDPSTHSNRTGYAMVRMYLQRIDYADSQLDIA